MLWASYSAADLSDDGLLVTQQLRDAGCRRALVHEPRRTWRRLGPALVFTVIEGGNHEQMGWYTGQPNDPPATIPREEQQARIVAATLEMLDALVVPEP